MMEQSASIDTTFQIDLEWWRSQGRNLGRILCEILGDETCDASGAEPLDYIDPDTAEVHQLDPLWVRVLMHHAHRPDYITATTPLANAVLRALIENLNQPMTVVELHRRINRSSPGTLLRLMRTARTHYGIVPVASPGPPRKRTK